MTLYTAGDVRPWRHGHCEWQREACGKRGRWLVGGWILCAQHARDALGDRPQRVAERLEERP